MHKYTNIGRNLRGVYAIVHIDAGVVYVGSTGRCIYNRLSWHTTKLRAGEHKSDGLQGLWDRDGDDAFRYVVLELCEDHLDAEKVWASMFDGLMNNRVPGSYVRTNEDRQKISEGRARYLDTPGARESLSERARKQHAQGNFGRATWVSA